MQRTFFKLLQEKQATAAKNLGILENSFGEHYLDQSGMEDLQIGTDCSRSDDGNGTKAVPQSTDLLTLREFQIW